MVLEQYAGDTEEAIVCLIDGCHWNDTINFILPILSYELRTS